MWKSSRFNEINCSTVEKMFDVKDSLVKYTLVAALAKIYLQYHNNLGKGLYTLEHFTLYLAFVILRRLPAKDDFLR
jgi:hypothetical protein